ncbi:MAG: SGNH/GDSL hydrolase family protein [Devosia sp.]
MRRILLLALVMVICAAEFAPVMGQGFLFGPPGVVGRPRYQQQYQDNQQYPRPRRRSLLDMLFGPQQDNNGYAPSGPSAPSPQPQSVAPPPKRKPQPPALPPAKPAVAKADNATRVAVFGDYMAADVGKALDRFYANDPTVSIIQQAVPGSGFARPEYFDWNKTIGQQIAANSFDVAVVMVGVNDRQQMKVDGGSVKALSDDWNKEYTARLNTFLGQLKAANKPVIFIGLPPMAAPQFSNAMSQISSLDRIAAFAAGAQFVDIYDKFLDENGDYEQRGPDVNGNDALMRYSDGVRLARAGADKVAFYASQAIKLFVHGGTGVAVADPLAGTDADAMLRPPYQGLGQSKLLQVAGAVMPLTGAQPRAPDLIERGSTVAAGFDMKQLLEAPVGRADAFGAGINPEAQPAAK